LIGETLGQKYKLVRLLGRGGMGSVYEAEQAGSLDRVAVKVLHSHLLVPGGDGPRRFRREAEAVLAIRSDHVVRVLDAGADEATGHLYLVTERLDGEDLQRLLDRLGPLAPGAALRVAAQALAGLVEAHGARVVHRDIKPANLFLARRPDGTMSVKLLDFGIAKLRADPLSPGLTADLTTTGSFLGSPLYMSPEQVQSSRDVDHRSDVWSLGCVLYAALAGRAPHQHLTSIGQLLVAICVSKPPPLSEVAPWVAPEVAAVVQRALELRPDARYPSAAAMLEAIRPLVPEGALVDEMLVTSGERPRGLADSGSHPSEGGGVASSSTMPSSPPPSPRVVVAPGLDRPIRGDEPTPMASRAVPRSGVPAVGARAGARQITVDPRRFLGENSELWTFSLDVHRHLASLLARIWKALRRAGATVPPMTYGTLWVLFEPRTGRAIVAESGQGAEPLSLEAAGIRPGTVLWLLPPDAIPRGSADGGTRASEGGEIEGVKRPASSRPD
jgi:serine/threonine protein kinase